MARQLFDRGIFSVLGVDGDIGVGWGLGFYAAGLDTPITTYTLPSGGSANGNPLTADAGGRFPPAWIDEGQSIKFVLYDDDGVVVRTLDNLAIAASVPTIATGLLAFLAGSAPLPIANGGTGSTTAVSALSALGAFAAAGGTITGDITRTSGGVYHYWAATAMTKGKWYLTASAAPDPRTPSPGEVWLKY